MQYRLQQHCPRAGIRKETVIKKMPGIQIPGIFIPAQGQSIYSHAFAQASAGKPFTIHNSPLPTHYFLFLRSNSTSSSNTTTPPPI